MNDENDSFKDAPDGSDVALISGSIDIHKELIKNPSSTFYGRVAGNSLKDAGIDNGDLLVIDKSLEPEHGKIAVCVLNGEFTAKRINKINDELYLMPENDDYQPIKVDLEDYFMIWGIVTAVIKKT